ncbi:hypothetical protein GF312_16185 [Candidatus Poribacteria bacterium]|nr:hypothetical protein [Candidatus Poribacteria bacterium]
MKRYLGLFILTCLCVSMFCSSIRSDVLNDPNVPDGETFVWRWVREGEEPQLSLVKWSVSEWEGKPVYKITSDSGNTKHAEYILNKSDMQLLYFYIIRTDKEHPYEVTMKAKEDKLYLEANIEGDKKDKDIDRKPDGYNGIMLAYCLRGFPFGKKEEIELHITPPFSNKLPLWAWKMWGAYAKVVAEEKVTVPAGTFDCYKLEVGASGGIIGRLTSEYYFWYEKTAPYRFIRYQEKDGKSYTELMELRCKGEEK